MVATRAGNLSAENLYQFAQRWGRIADTQSFDNFLKMFVARMCGELKRETAKRTPVDTGLLRSSWQVPNTLGKKMAAYMIYLTNTATSGKRASLKGQKIRSKYKNVKYMKYVEKGTMHYKGRKMYEKSLKIIRQKLKSRFSKEFKQYILIGYAPISEGLPAMLDELNRSTYGGS